METITIDPHGGDIYTHRQVQLDFSVNLNPLGMPEEICRAVAENVRRYDVYPDPRCRALREALAARESVPEDWLCFGNGAADLIVRIAAALGPVQALVPAPTFSEYETAVLRQGGRVRRAPCCEARGVQITRAFAEAVQPGDRLVFLCNPNNPTGRLAEPGTVEAALAACARVGAVLVVDECFLAFTEGASCLPLLWSAPNLIVLRAFTKLYSMAGLRLGYLLCTDPDLRGRVEAAGQCWSVSAPAQVAGLAALGCRDLPERTRAFLREERPRVAAALGEIFPCVYPSDANFLLFRGDSGLWERTLANGVMLRACGNYPGLDQRYYRIGLKGRAENDELLALLRAQEET
ncbi:MAG: aminotransferase class I/II-fold pyridoxal phosphate-dependent enzyme [Oscillospiraceae bacterium]|nr:aminotransferase class I/II-fold pyridoxal phosphate-dependent enzyme [Oscillospiraceae bacterium]